VLRGLVCIPFFDLAAESLLIPTLRKLGVNRTFKDFYKAMVGEGAVPSIPNARSTSCCGVLIIMLQPEY
jgi:hypothetical protein